MSNPYVEKTYSILRENDENNMDISYILTFKNKDNTTGFKAIVYSHDDPEDILQVSDNLNGYMIYTSIPHWDFNVEDYILADLEDGFEINYMPLDQHYGIWCGIEAWRNEIEHTDGLHKYLSYCQRHGITKEAIQSLLLEPVDITDLYVENNNGYKIIADMSCGNDAIVLGYKRGAPSEYVTWRTTKNRKYGYDVGHYFSNYNSAFSDYKKRCHDMVDHQLNIDKMKSKPKEKKDHER